MSEWPVLANVKGANKLRLNVSSNEDELEASDAFLESCCSSANIFSRQMKVEREGREGRKGVQLNKGVAARCVARGRLMRRDEETPRPGVA